MPRKVYEVQAIKNRWGINEDAEETRKRRDEKVIRTLTASANSNENGPDRTGSKGDTGGKGSNGKENWTEEPKKKKWAEQMANDMDNYEMCGKNQSCVKRERKGICKLYPWARMTMQLCNNENMICAI